MVALSEVNGGPWASAAEFSLIGCPDLTYGIKTDDRLEKINAFPVPTNGLITISLPSSKELQYRIVFLTGQVVEQGNIINVTNSWTFNLSDQTPGIYFIYLIDERGVNYRVKVIKK